MSELAARPMTIAEFLSWQELQEVRCELVDGRPVAMTGASFAHDRVVGNLRWALKNRLRAANSPCASFGAGIGVAITPSTLRRPDVAVYCPPFDETAAKSDSPRLIVEVLSRSTEHVDYFIKVEEYKTIGALNTILLISPHTVNLGVWTRNDGGWKQWRSRSIDDVVDLSDLGIALPVCDIYDDATLTPPVTLGRILPFDEYLILKRVDEGSLGHLMRPSSSV